MLFIKKKKKGGVQCSEFTKLRDVIAAGSSVGPVRGRFHSEVVLLMIIIGLYRLSAERADDSI